MTDPKTLLTGGVTLAAVKPDGTFFTSDQRGIAPLLSVLEQNRTSLCGAVCADRIVGKAAAMLFVLCGVCFVYGEVMSKAGEAFLTEHGVAHGYGVLTDRIVNRAGTGMCPMEQTVLHENDPLTAETLLREKVSLLRKEMAS